MFITLLTAVLFTSSAFTSSPDPGKHMVQAATKLGCRGNRAPLEMARELVAIEEAAGFPAEVRGILLAAACNESGFNPHAGGDRRHAVTGAPCRGDDACLPTSIGLMQFGGWAKSKMGTASTKDPRYDWRASARFWAAHVASQVPRVRRECPSLRRGWDQATELDVWRAAHRTAITKPKCGRYVIRGSKQVCANWVPRCHRLGRAYRSSHWRIWERWRSQSEPPEEWRNVPRALKP